MIVGQDGIIRQSRFFIPATPKSEPVTGKPVEDKTLRIESRVFAESSLPFRLEFVLRRRNMSVLAALASIAVGAVLVSLLGPSSLLSPLEPDSGEYYVYYFLCYLIAGMLFIVGKWLSEAALLRAPAITLAKVRGRAGSGSFLVEYEFTDPSGGYHGGSTMDFDRRKGDHLKVVFCNPMNPDFNKVSCGLMFHKIVWRSEAVHDTREGLT
jgi:hypothetical protein